MVAGRLQEKNGFYYIVLSYTDSAGKRRQPWIGTGRPVKGNKKRAEKMLAETRKSFTIPKGQVSELSPDMAFSDYMRYWLKMMRTAVTETTYSSYCFNVEKHIISYFEPLGITLAGLQPRQIQSFYLHEAETLKNTSILRFHANLHKALKYAVRIDLIASNPVDKVDRPKPQGRCSWHRRGRCPRSCSQTRHGYARCRCAPGSCTASASFPAACRGHRR